MNLVDTLRWMSHYVTYTALCGASTFLFTYRKDSEAFKCNICLQTFMSNARPLTLYEHFISKHSALDPVACFASLKDFDPADPKGLKKAAATPAATGPPKPKAKSKAELDLDLLLDAGIKKK
jgi:hypothetical protein